MHKINATISVLKVDDYSARLFIGSLIVASVYVKAGTYFLLDSIENPIIATSNEEEFIENLEQLLKIPKHSAKGIVMLITHLSF